MAFLAAALSVIENVSAVLNKDSWAESNAQHDTCMVGEKEYYTVYCILKCKDFAYMDACIAVL